MKPVEFRSVHDRSPVKGRGFTSEAQRQYLTKSDPELAHNMERFTSPTSFLPFRATPKRKRK